MVEIVTIGVLSIQGAVSEHILSMNRALKENHVNGSTVPIKQKDDVDELDALIIPGGESSTISKILHNSGIYDKISKRINRDSFPIMGTCAGCVLLAKEIVNNHDNIKSLQAMDMQVERNAFGRQKESFEKIIEIKGLKKSYNAVFIRAPIIKKVWDDCEILSEIDKKIVAARQDKFLALSFHPELTEDLRIHRYFLNMII